MGNNANKIVAVVAAVLVVAVIAMAMGSVGSVGGGGGPVAPAPSSTNATQQGSESLPDSTAEQAVSNEYETFEDARNKLLEEIDAVMMSAPVGSNVRDTASEQGVLSVSELSAELGSRGFSNLEIIATLDFSGTYLGKTVLDPTSSDKYPSYRIMYQSDKDVQWMIVVNGHFFYAVPLYSSGVAIEREIIVSESDVVVQFDGGRNQYSDFALDALEDVTGVKVPRIDAVTLDSYSGQDLAGM